MHKLEAGGEARRNLVTCTERVSEFAFAFCQTFSFPHRFQRRIVGENERPEVFLCDQFRFPFKKPIADPVLLIDRKSDRIDDWIGQVVNQLDRRIGIREPIASDPVLIIPVGQVDRCLQALGDSDLELMPKIDLIKIRIVARMSAPRDPRFQIKTARRRRGCFVNVCETTDTAGTTSCRQDRQPEDR